jgi:uncharacterized protein (DUF1810 family)
VAVYQLSDLDRFVNAQDRVWSDVLAELRAGRKTSHWMWFVFPQLAGLGMSETSRFYAIANIDEATAYLRHAILGPRLIECAELVLSIHGRSAHDIFDSPDDMKLKSCMTLFAEVSPGEPVFDRVLAYYFAGERDSRTLQLLGRKP